VKERKRKELESYSSLPGQTSSDLQTPVVPNL
jgi:hypothetical protein